MRCVLVSKSFDLRGYLGPQFMRAADRIEIISHPHEGPATDVRLAVAWHPPDDAFERYPNLQAVCSIGAGVDNILACPSLRPNVDVIRVVDPAQAQMMSGFVAWHVIGHQRRFAAYQAQQREERWQRLGLRRAQDVPVGILGFGEIGRTVAADLALLGARPRSEESVQAFVRRVATVYSVDRESLYYLGSVMTEATFSPRPLAETKLSGARERFLKIRAQVHKSVAPQLLPEKQAAYRWSAAETKLKS